MAKVMEGNAPAAIRAIVPDELLTVLHSKNPISPTDTLSGLPPSPDFVPFFDENQVMLALRSFKPSSSGGPDCLRLTHLEDLTTQPKLEARRRLRIPLTRLCNRFIREVLSPKMMN